MQQLQPLFETVELSAHMEVTVYAGSVVLMVKMPLDLILTFEQRVQSGSLSSLAGRRIGSISTSPPQSREIGIPPPQNLEAASARLSEIEEEDSGGGFPIWAIIVGAVLAVLGIVGALWLMVGRGSAKAKAKAEAEAKAKIEAEALAEAEAQTAAEAERLANLPDYEDFVLVDNVPIGSGSFADVYLARLQRKKFAGQLVAIKRFRPTDQTTADKRLREYHTMLNLQHEQLVKPYHAFMRPVDGQYQLNIVMEYCRCPHISYCTPVRITSME